MKIHVKEPHTLYELIVEAAVRMAGRGREIHSIELSRLEAQELIEDGVLDMAVDGKGNESASVYITELGKHIPVIIKE